MKLTRQKLGMVMTGFAVIGFAVASSQSQRSEALHDACSATELADASVLMPMVREIGRMDSGVKRTTFPEAVDCRPADPEALRTPSP